MNPILKETRIPFEMFSAPLKIREDLEFKRKILQNDEEKKFDEVKCPADLFEVDGKRTENIYILGEAGRGKTVQCYQLIRHWLKGREAERENKELSEWQKALVTFDFLFFVTLRHVAKSCKSVVEMICRSAMKNYPQYHDRIRQALTCDLDSCKCLIILDGLDEIKGNLDIIDVNKSRCTVLMTSRHRKFHALSPDIHYRDRVVEICSLDRERVEQVIETVLCNYFKLDSSYCMKIVTEIHNKIDDMNLKSVLSIPLVIIASIHLGQPSTSTERSMTCFFASLIDFLTKRAVDNERVLADLPKEHVDFTLQLPRILTRHKSLKDSFGAMLALGKMAYNDLVLRTLNSESNERTQEAQLVFEKDDLESDLGTSVLAFALEVGLLSQASAPGSFDEENVSINFFHKTIEEFLAALYIACSNEVSVDSFLSSCSCLARLMDFSNIFIFLVGMLPSLLGKVSKLFSDIADSDSDIRRYRLQMYDKDGRLSNEARQVKLLFKLFCDCHKETKHNQSLTPEINLGTECLVSDIYFDSTSDQAVESLVREILSKSTNHILSLYIDTTDIPCWDPDFDTALMQFLEQTSLLQLLHICRGMALCGIGTAFSSLTVLSLEDISMTCDSARQLQEAIAANTQLRVLRLRKINPCGFDEFICLDLKNSIHLVTLSILSKLVKLVDFKHCTDLSKLELHKVRIDDVQMFKVSIFFLYVATTFRHT